MKRLTIQRRTMASILLTSIISAMILALEQGAFAQGCERIDRSHPAQFITFERSGIGNPVYSGESKDRAWLRLHNNTTCPIRFLGGHIHRLPDGTFSMDPKDGEETSIEYDIYDALRSGEPHQWAGGNAHSIATLHPGFSVVFNVPASHFRAGQGIAVPFAYAWEGDAIRRFDLRHYVYLLPEDLPKNLRGQLRRAPAAEKQKADRDQYDPLLACREIAMMEEDLTVVPDDVMTGFRGIDSEVDGLPLGPERAYWDKDSLREQDLGAARYREQVRRPTDEDMRRC